MLLVGLIISWSSPALGALVALVFAFLWVRDLTADTQLAEARDVAPENAAAAARVRGRAGARAGRESYATDERYPRAKFLEISTLGLGAVIGGIVTLPALGFMVGPAFLKQGDKDHDIGPITDYPEGKYVVTTFTLDAVQGEVSRRTAFVRNNGQLNGQPSFTIISNHCAHLGCPVQPNGPLDPQGATQYEDVTLIPTISIAGFGCPCHGGQYDTEGNRIAGPPVRALDRYSFSIRNGHLFLGKPFSVSQSTAPGAQAKIHKQTLAYPGRARGRPRVLALSDPASALMATAKPTRGQQLQQAILYPLDWLEERSGLVGGVKYFLFRKVPGDINWFQTLGSATLTAFIVQALTGAILAMYYKPDPQHRLRVDPAHHERPLGRLARARHAPLGRVGLHHPACSCTWGACSCSAPTSTRAS